MASGLGSLRRVRDASLYARAARRPLAHARLSLDGLRRPDGRIVFVAGSPRSGTTFFAGALGSLPGFLDLGEVNPLKAAIPELAELDPDRAAERLRTILDRVRRLGLVGSRRAVEQTPETVFVLPALARAFQQATIVHLVRDGRDVVASLLERGWLRASRGGADDAGAPYGSQARFWVEPERQEEFATVSEARRAAWVWRRYVTTAREAGGDVHEVRYERLVGDSAATADGLARVLGVPAADLMRVLAPARADSVGRYRRDLASEQLEEVEAEAGDLLADLGYASRVEA